MGLATFTSTRRLAIKKSAATLKSFLTNPAQLEDLLGYRHSNEQKQTKKSQLICKGIKNYAINLPG